MREPCTEQCRMRCFEKCTDAQRLILFKDYYALANIECQWKYLADHIDKTVPKVRDRTRPRKYKTKTPIEPIEIIRNRTNNIRYYLNINSKRIRVCLKMFLATFDIGSKVIRTVANKTNDDGVLVYGDHRGNHKKTESIPFKIENEN